MPAGEITNTIESYLEAIFELQEIGERVTQARLARWFQVSPPATSEVVHRMEKLNLIELTADKTIELANEGRKLAEAMAGRHRIIERYLVDVLGVQWHLSDDETRKIEPGISEVVFQRMKAALGPATTCPHGNPIPGLAPASTVELVPLDGCPAGTEAVIDRIREDLELDLDMLRYLEEHRLVPGTQLKVSNRDPHGAVTVESDSGGIAVGPEIASHVLCVLR